ncbi:MAG: 50S ribosomal protein L25/general stress protein Ctc [Pseudomonadota bacterium]
MAAKFELVAEFRDDKGKGASRRLRRTGRVPVIMYGGGREPRSLSVNHEALIHQLENEAFYSSILNVKVGDEDQDAILKDIQRHPAKRVIMHLDLQRVVAGEKIRVSVPLHFVNEDIAVGVKQEGGTVFHNLTELEISVLPKNLPEYIEVDVAEVELGASLYISDVKLPEGVEIAGGSPEDQVVSIARVKVVEEIEEGAEEAAEGDEPAADAPSDGGDDTPTE